MQQSSATPRNKRCRIGLRKIVACSGDIVRFYTQKQVRGLFFDFNSWIFEKKLPFESYGVKKPIFTNQFSQNTVGTLAVYLGK